jgi:hypothetical protein
MCESRGEIHKNESLAEDCTTLIVRDRSQENMMNAHGSFYSVVVVNKPKKIITINTMQTIYLRSVPHENNTGGKINGNSYMHKLFSIR